VSIVRTTLIIFSIIFLFLFLPHPLDFSLFILFPTSILSLFRHHRCSFFILVFSVFLRLLRLVQTCSRPSSHAAMPTPCRRCSARCPVLSPASSRAADGAPSAVDSPRAGAASPGVRCRPVPRGRAVACSSHATAPPPVLLESLREQPCQRAT
jgi:hypothetical protein